MDEVENNDSIKKFILERKQALAQLTDVDSEKMIQVIIHLGLRFVCIDIKGVDHSVLEYIFEENQYELNISMVTSLFEYKYPENVEELKKANYSTICKTSDESLLWYVHINFEDYVTEFVLEQDTNICEDINAVEDILERLYKTNPEICKAVLDKENVRWKDLNDCCICGDEEDKNSKKIIWNVVLKNRMINASWHNFMCYYEQYQLTSNLVTWVNEEVDQLIQDSQVENITDKITKEIIVADVSPETFEKIIKKFKVKEFTNSLHNFTSEKIGIMVKEQYIPFSITLLDEMKEVTTDFIKEYIIYNKKYFFEDIKYISLDLHIIAQLLSANELDNNEKVKLFNLFKKEEIDMELALVIRKLLFKVPKSYVESVWEVLPKEDRYQLLLNQLDVYSLDEISDKLLMLAPVYQKLSDRSRRHREYLDDDDIGYNKKLLDKLKYREYLTSVETETYHVYNEIIRKREEKKRFAVWVKKKQ